MYAGCFFVKILSKGGFILSSKVVRGMIFQHSDDVSGWSSYLIKMYVVNDIQTYLGHRVIRCELKDDYSIYGYEPAKYDIFVPETADQTSRYMSSSQSFTDHNIPVVLQTVSNDTLTFKPIFDLDVNVLVHGSYNTAELLSTGLSTVLLSLFAGVSNIISNLDIHTGDNQTIMYENPTTVTMSDIWEKVFSIQVISTYYAPYFTAEYNTSNHRINLTVDNGIVNFIPIKLQTNQILEVDQTTNFDSTEGCNIVGGYLSDGTLYGYMWLDNNSLIHFSSTFPPANETHTSLVVKYVQIDSADNGVFQSKGLSELERTISAHQSELDLKLNLKDINMNQLQVGGWVYLQGYLQYKPLQVHLRELDYQSGAVVVGSNSNISLV